MAFWLHVLRAVLTITGRSNQGELTLDMQSSTFAVVFPSPCSRHRSSGLTESGEFGAYAHTCLHSLACTVMQSLIMIGDADDPIVGLLVL